MEKQDSIVVNLTELYKTIRQMRKDDMYLVELQIMPPDEDEGVIYPATLELSGISSSDKDFMVNYDPLEAVDVPLPNGQMSSTML